MREIPREDYRLILGRAGVADRLPSPLTGPPLRELISLRQRGKIGRHRPPRVQQRFGRGAAGDPGEVPPTLHPAGRVERLRPPCLCEGEGGLA